MWRYPESLNRVIMVSVNPPGHFIWDPAVTDAQIAHYAELCAKDAACSARTVDLVATMRKSQQICLIAGWVSLSIKRLSNF
jgi:hypothetical protein